MDLKQPAQGQDEAKHAKFIAGEIKKLENQIEMYQDVLETDTEDSDTFNLLGQAYQKLAVLKNDASFNTKAKEAYTQAINLAPEDSLLLADRARFYASIHESEQAVQDFQKLQSLQQQQKGTSHLTDLMVTNTLKELAKLDSIKKTIQNLRAKGSLPAEFLDAFDELSNITRRLVVQVAHNTEQINRLSVLLQEITVKIEQGQVTNEEVQILKAQVNEQKEEMKRIHEILILSGVRDKVDLKKRFEELQKRDPELYVYANTFYWTLLNMFGAYRHLSTGVIVAEQESSQAEGMIVDGVKKVVSAGLSIGKALPFVGGLFEYTDNAIDYVYGWFKGKSAENKITIINKLLRAKFKMEDDISLGVARLTLVMIMNPKKIAFIKRTPPPPSSSQTQNVNFIHRYYNQMNEYAENVKAQWWPGLKEDENSFVTSQAVQDVTLLLAYLCVNFSPLIQEDSPLEKQIETILAQDRFDKMLAKIEGQAGKCACGEFYVPRDGGAASACSLCKIKSKGGVKCPKCPKKVCISCYQN